MFVVALWAIVGIAFLPSVARAENPPEITIEINAFIDGRSQLILRGNTAQWHHFDFAAPGRHNNTNYPTTINGVDWYPVWPDIPDPENRGCNCFSDVFAGVVPALPAKPLEIELQIVSVVHPDDPGEPAGPVTIVQSPTRDNNFTVIVEFNDNSSIGPAFYDVKLLVRTPAINIKPRIFPNRINPRSKGMILVTILTTKSFDATTIDPTTVRFGPTGTEAAAMHSVRWDVDRDRHADMILFFKTRDTGIACGDTSVSLTGETLGGQAIAGSDTIKTVLCK